MVWGFFLTSKYHTNQCRALIYDPHTSSIAKTEITIWQRCENFPGLVPWFIRKKPEAQGSEMTCLK